MGVFMVAFGRRVEPASLDKVDAAMRELKEARFEKMSNLKKSLDKFFDKPNERPRNGIITSMMEEQTRTFGSVLRKGDEIGIFNPDSASSILSSEAAYLTADLRLQGFHKWHNRTNSSFGRLAQASADRYSVQRAYSILQDALTVLYQNEEKILKDATYATRNAASGDEVNRIAMLESRQTNSMEMLLVSVAEYLRYGYITTQAAATKIIQDLVGIGSGAALVEHVSRRQNGL